MAHLFDNHPDDAGYQASQEAQETRQPVRKRSVTLAIAAALLAVIGASSAVLWHSFSGSLPAMPSFASITGSSAAPAAVVAPDKPVGVKDFQAFQQQIAGPMQSAAQLHAVQQAEIKRLSDQLAILTAKIDLLERPAAAQSALPAQAPPVSQAKAAAPRKRPAARKPADSISVGGAPLPPPVLLGR